MTQEEKQLLLKDLCSRLPYGVIVDNPNPAGGAWDELISIDIPTGTVTLLYDGRTYKVEKIKPYLRPMSSMTEEECKTLGDISATLENKLIEVLPNTPYYIEVAVPDQIDWLNQHHFDYRGLIEKGLALEAPEDMYKIE